MDVEIIKSNRKSIALEIKPDGRVICRAPRGMKDREIEKFIHNHELWIKRTLIKVENSEKEKGEFLSEEELELLKKQARKIIPDRVKYYASIIGVDYGRIAIRSQKTRWGSCSTKGNLNFNCRLMLAPIEVLDSVIVHELCHRKEMNHSKKFYALVHRYYPEYDKWNKWLKENGDSLYRRGK